MNHDDTNRKKPGFLGCKCFDCIFTSKNVINVTKSTGLSSSTSKLDRIGKEKKLFSEDKKLISEEKNESQKKIYDHHVAVAKDFNSKLKKDNFLSPPNSVLDNSIGSYNDLVIKRQRSKSEIGI
jgi:hypothetical protein